MDISDAAEAPIENAGAATFAALLSRLQRGLRRGVRAHFPLPTLPQSQVEVLRLLDRSPGLPVHQVAAALRLAPNTTSTVVQQLVRQGYVARRVDRDDRRVARLHLTEAAGQRLARWSDARTTVLAEALGGLSEGDRDRVRAALPVLERLAELLERPSE
ncbi:MAG TPA: MarR family winged helix-turn-helix transcriptional regulator [Chloroflexota bacterium]|nr:MarR family winged helix-turn-helix transcriptional regulator [Chloroflexota bacterium]